MRFQSGFLAIGVVALGVKAAESNLERQVNADTCDTCCPTLTITETPWCPGYPYPEPSTVYCTILEPTTVFTTAVEVSTHLAYTTVVSTKTFETSYPVTVTTLVSCVPSTTSSPGYPIPTYGRQARHDDLYCSTVTTTEWITTTTTQHVTLTQPTTITRVSVTTVEETVLDPTTLLDPTTILDPTTVLVPTTVLKPTTILDPTTVLEPTTIWVPTTTTTTTTFVTEVTVTITSDQTIVTTQVVTSTLTTVSTITTSYPVVTTVPTTVTVPPETVTVPGPPATTPFTVTLCPMPTGRFEPRRSDSRQIWGCDPGFLCQPPMPDGCNFWPDLPERDFICEPEYCKPAPKFETVVWPENETTYFPPQAGYFHMNPEAFGLLYDIFEVTVTTKTKHGHTKTITTGNWESQATASWPDAPPLTTAAPIPEPYRAVSVRDTHKWQKRAVTPGPCMARCQRASHEAQEIGLVEPLCDDDSDFRVAYEACESCIAGYMVEGQDTIRDYVEPTLAEWLEFCGIIPPLDPTDPTSMTSPDAGVTSVTVTTETQISASPTTTEVITTTTSDTTPTSEPESEPTTTTTSDSTSDVSSVPEPPTSTSDSTSDISSVPEPPTSTPEPTTSSPESPSSTPEPPTSTPDSDTSIPTPPSSVPSSVPESPSSVTEPSSIPTEPTSTDSGPPTGTTTTSGGGGGGGIPPSSSPSSIPGTVPGTISGPTPPVITDPPVGGGAPKMIVGTTFAITLVFMLAILMG